MIGLGNAYISACQVLSVRRESQTDDLSSRVIKDRLRTTIRGREMDLLILSPVREGIQYPLQRHLEDAAYRSAISQNVLVQGDGRTAFLHLDGVELLAILKQGHARDIGDGNTTGRRCNSLGSIDIAIRRHGSTITR